MKIQIDTTTKTIQIEESIKLEDFFKLLEELLPNNKWKEYTIIPYKIEINNPINPVYPINPIMPVYPINPVNPSFPSYPWSNPVITC